MDIVPLDGPRARRDLNDLVDLLRDTVDSGASIGFLPPMDASDAQAYWTEAIAAVESGSRILLAAYDSGRLAGSVQLDLPAKPNARHRGEVMKLMVHRSARRAGLGRALMQAIEGAAARLGRTLLVLDTREGDPSDHLYTSLGYIRAGTIPGYARSASGALHATVFFYKQLAEASC